MDKSENINELAGALAKAQGEIQNATKNAVNPHLKSRYADLAAVLVEALPVLSKNGIAVSQTHLSRDNNFYLLTTLMHSSGQWLSSEIPLILQKQDMQGLGSATTYARRYALASICGIHQEDDDGGGALKVTEAKDLKPLNHAPQTSKPDAATCKHKWVPSSKHPTKEYCIYCSNFREAYAG